MRPGPGKKDVAPGGGLRWTFAALHLAPGKILRNLGTPGDLRGPGSSRVKGFRV